jgi:hypothetical protein
VISHCLREPRGHGQEADHAAAGLGDPPRSGANRSGAVGASVRVAEEIQQAGHHSVADLGVLSGQPADRHRGTAPDTRRPPQPGFRDGTAAGQPPRTIQFYRCDVRDSAQRLGRSRRLVGVVSTRRKIMTDRLHLSRSRSVPALTGLVHRMVISYHRRQRNDLQQRAVWAEEARRTPTLQSWIDS